MINEETQKRIKALENDGHDKPKKSKGHKKKHDDDGTDTEAHMEHSAEEPLSINGINGHHENGHHENGIATNGHHDNENGHDINGNGHELTENGNDHNDDN